MVPRVGKKWTSLIWIVFLAAAVMGSFAFSIAETLPRGEFGGSAPFPAASFRLISDNLAEDSIAIGKDSRHYSSFPRSGGPRVFLPAGISGIDLRRAGSSPQANKKLPFSTQQESLRLIFRI